MDISVSKQAGRVEVTVLGLNGQLDGQTYQELITKTKELYESGSRDFLLDLSDLTYISSAGLVALHSVALLVKGEALPDTDAGWSAYRSMGKTSSSGTQTHVKLFNPRSEVLGVLDMVGFNSAFAIFTDLDEAVKSF